MLSFAGMRYASGEIRADRARAAWEQGEARRTVALARTAAERPVREGRIPLGVPVARVIAPKIRLDAIVLEGVDDDELDAAPGHVPGTAIPGEHGNAVISAHRDRHFNRLGSLAVGDTIVTESDAGQVHWVIVSRRIIEKSTAALFRTSTPTLTLTTCWPMRYIGSAPERLIVTAKPIGAE
jgi:sortase A